MDWLKHAFITRFNDIPADAYKDYTVLLASDLIMCKQKYVSNTFGQFFFSNSSAAINTDLAFTGRLVTYTLRSFASVVDNEVFPLWYLWFRVECCPCGVCMMDIPIQDA